jgi:hypothetical protein
MRIEPEGSITSSVSIITMIAVQVGNDRVTFGIAGSRPQLVWVDGAPVNISPTSPVFTLPGGTVTEVSTNDYRVVWNTGEVVNVQPSGDGMSVSVTLASGDSPGSIQGFLGPDEGQANDFQLPDGTVLPQPLTQDELYQEFANAWRVTDATSLMDYAQGQDTATFTDTMYPREVLTLADFPPDLVAAAAALAAAAGITDPTLAAEAEFDYITMGDPAFFSEDAAAGALDPTVATPAVITQPVPPPPSIGVLAADAKITESTGASTPVTFDLDLTSAAVTDTVVDYSVVSGGSLGTGMGEVFFTAADFGGIVPSGTVTIAAGQTLAAFTIDVPATALGLAPDKWLQVEVSSPGGTTVFSPTAQADIVNNTPEPGSPAEPVIEFLQSAIPVATENAQTLTLAGNDYTLDLGQVLSNEAFPPLQFAVANAATLTSDSLSSVITAISGSGFYVSGTQPPAQLAPGMSYQDLYFQPLTTSLGAQSESITLASDDVNESGYFGALPTLTLTVTDTVLAPAEAAVNTPSVLFPNVRVGTAESQTISVSNVAAAGAADLDVALTAGPGTDASGSVSLLAPGSSDDTDLVVGLDTNTGGLLTGTVTVDVFSDLGNGVMVPALPSPTVTVSGPVYREAEAGVALTDPVVHVGDPETDALSVTNIDPADGYSEDLIAAVSATSGQLGIVSAGPIGELAAGTSDTSALAANFSTAQAGTIAGSVTLTLTSDGGVGAGSIDGLGTIQLAPQVFDVTATINNYATAELENISGGSDIDVTDGTIDLGTLGLGTSPVAIDLAVLNAAAGPADLLTGSFDISGDSAFINSGFDAIAGGLAAGEADTLPTVSLATSAAGVFSETITLDATGSNASGYSGALTPETLTITGTIVPTLVQSIGTPGAPGGPGNAGSSGQSVTATADNPSAPENSADSEGGAGGAGGNGSMSATGAGGNAGAGAAGGGAAASASGSPVADASATGGAGGAGGAPGQGTTSGHGGVGGAGGTATASATAVNNAGSATATANATGGAGGAASGAADNPAGGGVASGTTASAVGTTAATASVTQTGGAGGAGSQGAPGNSGAASTLNDAVSGETEDGVLTLNQTAVGGAGGGQRQQFWWRRWRGEFIADVQR